jgi:hypothetical protein
MPYALVEDKRSLTFCGKDELLVEFLVVLASHMEDKR